MNKPLEEVFKLDNEVIEIAEANLETPQNIFEALKSKAITKEQFLAACGTWYQYIETKRRGLKAAYEPLIDEMKADISHLDSKLNFIKSTIRHYFPPGPEIDLVTDQVRLFYKEDESTDVVSPEMVPLKWCRQYEPEPKKTEILAAMKAGEEVPGCRIKTEYHLQIKPGGVRAVHNAKQRQKRIAKEGQGAIDEN